MRARLVKKSALAVRCKRQRSIVRQVIVFAALSAGNLLLFDIIYSLWIYEKFGLVIFILNLLFYGL